MEEESRIIERNWEKYTCGEVVFQPKLMSAEKLQEGYNWCSGALVSWCSICFNKGGYFLENLPVTVL